MALPPHFSTNDIAQMADVSRNTVYRWYREGLPFAQAVTRGDRKTSPHELWIWIEKHGVENYRAMLARQGREDIPEVGLTQEEETLRLTKAKADAQELNNQQTRGELGNVSEFESMFRESMVLIRKSMLDLPGRLAADMERATDRAQIRHHLMTEIKTVLNAAADGLTTHFAHLASGETAAPPANDDTVAVGGAVSETAFGQ